MRRAWMFSLLLASFTPVASARPAGEGAPAPRAVRLTTQGGRYLQAPGLFSRRLGLKATHSPSDRETFFLVDWNGGLVQAGDLVSIATEMRAEPDYLTAVGAEVVTRKLAGDGTAWTIRKVAGRADGILRHGDTVALEIGGRCATARPDGGVTLSPCARAPEQSWRFWQKIRPFEGPGPFAGRAEWCFGGQGDGCFGARGLGILGLEGKDVGQNGLVELPASVGAILHDNCCLRRPLGKMCGGAHDGKTTDHTGAVMPRGTLAVELSGRHSTMECSGEWQKAWDASLIGKRPLLSMTWRQQFGPYRNPEPGNNCPGCTAVGMRGWGLASDALVPATTARRTRMTATAEWPAYSGNPYGDGNEVARYPTADGALFAPAGATLDESDASFCRSGKLEQQRCASALAGGARAARK